MPVEERNKILFLIPYPKGKAPGQRFRFELYLHDLAKSRYRYELLSFYDERLNNILYKKGRIIQKLLGLIRCFMSRIIHLWKARSYDYIFIFREVAPIGPPIFEWILCHLLNKTVIYDFDDAIWMPDPHENQFIAWIKCKWKVRFICQWSTIIVTGNDYLKDFANRFNPTTVVIPTVVDTENYHFPVKKDTQTSISIGWTGTHSTLIYLDDIKPVLDDLYNRYKFTFIVIANRSPEWNAPYLRFIPWDNTSEIDDLNKIDIGIMPLTPSPWSEGKCGFKIIQYLALEIPAIASNVGVNAQIIDHGLNGFICESQDDWYFAIESLLTDDNLRDLFGKNGRRKIESQFSVSATRFDFLNLFNSKSKRINPDR